MWQTAIQLSQVAKRRKIDINGNYGYYVTLTFIKRHFTSVCYLYFLDSIGNFKSALRGRFPVMLKDLET